MASSHSYNKTSQKGGQFEARRTKSYSSFGKEQQLPKLPADDLNAAQKNPKACKVLQNLVDILTTWNDSDWRQLAVFDEQLRAVFDTFEFRDLDLKAVYTCIGVASIFPLTHFPSVSFGFSSKELSPSSHETPVNLEEYTLLAQERKKNWVLEARTMAAEMSALEAKLASDEASRKEVAAIKKISFMEKEIEQLKAEILELKSVASMSSTVSLTGSEKGALKERVAADSSCELDTTGSTFGNDACISSNIEVSSILRELEEMRNELCEFETAESSHFDESENSTENNDKSTQISINRIQSRQAEIFSKIDISSGDISIN